jgi:thioredoxin-dependent peroxiredoxin
VIGVSPDGVNSHAKFRNKFNLGFTLLADPERKLIEPLGLWIEKSLYGKNYMGVDRTTFLIGPDGKVEMIWTKVKPEGHAQEVLNYLRES